MVSELFLERPKCELNFPIVAIREPVSCHEPLPCKSPSLSSHLLFESDTFIFNLTPFVEPNTNILYLVMGYPLVRYYYFNFIKHNKIYNNQLTMPLQNLIFP